MAKKTQSLQGRKPGNSPWIWVLSILGLAVILIVVLLVIRPFGRGGENLAALAKEIPVAQAFEMREKGAFILDVRQPAEWEEFHIPDATLIPLDQLESRISEVPKNREIVVVCRSGSRSAVGRDLLLSAGYKSVTSVAGGMTEWRSAGYPTTSGP